ncbi:hypothetical protein OEZ85_011624 [Tetradesmus obliquus]|uniref:Uncharacterized protein n=1 Tax=Tetradesmus obliquus TaxID=3088 RepID=A0ABY8TTB4_TETOB|nr:hypothetical protein OEZ85_011624 [Tetradesmus obliquus]
MANNLLATKSAADSAIGGSMAAAGGPQAGAAQGQPDRFQEVQSQIRRAHALLRQQPTPAEKTALIQSLAVLYTKRLTLVQQASAEAHPVQPRSFPRWWERCGDWLRNMSTSCTPLGFTSGGGDGRHKGVMTPALAAAGGSDCSGNLQGSVQWSCILGQPPVFQMPLDRQPV